MSICHLHILITNKTAVDISESFREESKLCHAQTSPWDSQRALVALSAKAARRSGSDQLCAREEPAWHSTCSTHVCWRRCWKEATLGEKQGEIRWDNQLQYLKACD